MFTFALKKNKDMREIHLNCVAYCWCILNFYLYLHQHISNRKRCACNDVYIQGVESGKFKLEMMNMKVRASSLPYRAWISLSSFLYFGFYQNLTLRKCRR